MDDICECGHERTLHQFSKRDGIEVAPCLDPCCSCLRFTNEPYRPLPEIPAR